MKTRIGLVILSTILIIFREQLLMYIGDFLIVQDTLQTADVIHVIAGVDYRTDYAIQLYKQEYGEKLFAFSEQDLIDAKLIKPSGKGVRVIQSNPALWSEYSNIVSHCHITVLNFLDQLEKLLHKAEELIQLLQKEYHLK